MKPCQNCGAFPLGPREQEIYEFVKIFLRRGQVPKNKVVMARFRLKKQRVSQLMARLRDKGYLEPKSNGRRK